MIQTTTICPGCGDNIELSDQGVWLATCVHACAAGGGETPEDALADWATKAESLRAAALSSLATFIVPEPPEGYRLRVTEVDDVLGFYDTYPATLADAYATGADIYYGPQAGQKAANQ